MAYPGHDPPLDADYVPPNPSVTKVVKISKIAGIIRQDCDVYIGSRVRNLHWDLQDSPFRNPYHPREFNYDECKLLQAYYTHILSSPPLIAKLPDLFGKRLGCFCAPYSCHGYVLVSLVNEIIYPNFESPTLQYMLPYLRHRTDVPQLFASVPRKNPPVPPASFHSGGVSMLPFLAQPPPPLPTKRRVGRPRARPPPASETSLVSILNVPKTFGSTSMDQPPSSMMETVFPEPTPSTSALTLDLTLPVGKSTLSSPPPIPSRPLPMPDPTMDVNDNPIPPPRTDSLLMDRPMSPLRRSKRARKERPFLAKLRRVCDVPYKARFKPIPLNEGFPSPDRVPDKLLQDDSPDDMEIQTPREGSRVLVTLSGDSSDRPGSAGLPTSSSK